MLKVIILALVAISCVSAYEELTLDELDMLMQKVSQRTYRHQQRSTPRKPIIPQEYEEEDERMRCKAGEYWVYKAKECQKCSPNCKTCIGDFDNCQSCFGKQKVEFRQDYNACVGVLKENDEDLVVVETCKPGEFWKNVDGNCQKCDSEYYKCKTCEHAANNCKSCVEGYKVVNTLGQKNLPYGNRCVKDKSVKKEEENFEEEAEQDLQAIYKKVQKMKASKGKKVKKATDVHCSFGYEKKCDEYTKKCKCMENGRIGYSAVAATAVIFALAGGVYIFKKKRKQISQKKKDLLTDNIGDNKASLLSVHQL